jgi:RNA polymerase sigma-70 factor, ECF subfamily
MSNLKFLERREGKRLVMFFSKSITFDQEELNEVALAAGSNSIYSTVENEFIERLKAGEAEAFDELVNRYTANIYSLLIRLTEDTEEARDLTQETFLSALKAIKNFRGDADLKTWLYRIAVNESRNRFRWWKRRNRSTTISLDAENVFGQSQNVADSAENPEAAALRRERESALRQALSELPTNFREVVVLRDIEGLSYEEVAAALETNVGTVKSRIARGREELRRKLSGF